MTPELILLVLLVAGMTLYALLGGADFGAGVWEFNTALRATKKERDLIYQAIGPVWETNHVWLIFVMVVLWSAFAPAFEGVCRALWVPLSLALVGIIFRGVGFAFRSYAAGDEKQEALWGAVFAFASTAAPFFLGASAWAIASGRLLIEPNGDYAGDHLTGWISPVSIFGGFYGVGICAYMASVYLTREAHHQDEDDLVALWRFRAIGTGLWMGVLSGAGLWIVATYTTEVWAGFGVRAWPVIAGSGVCGVASLGCLLLRRYTWASVMASGTVAFVMAGWGLAQFPYLVPPNITVEGAKSPDAVMWAMIIVTGLGVLILGPSLWFLFSLFKGKRPEQGINTMIVPDDAKRR